MDGFSVMASVFPFLFFIVFGIILIVFGPTKLPTLGKSMGEAIKNFKDGLNKVEVKDENTNETK